MGGALTTPGSSREWDPVYERLKELEAEARELFLRDPNWMNRALDTKLQIQWRICMNNLKAILFQWKTNRHVSEGMIQHRFMLLSKHQSERELRRHAWLSQMGPRYEERLLEEDDEGIV